MAASEKQDAYFRIFDTTLGPFGVLFGSQPGKILASGFTSNATELARLAGVPEATAMGVTTSETALAVSDYLEAYFSGRQSPFPLDLTLDQPGTPFQDSVWKEISQIPYASSSSYGDIAAKIGQPKGPRAVGSACGANRLALFIPCHRVINGSGAVGHYRWGSAIKSRLLAHEGPPH